LCEANCYRLLALFGEKEENEVIATQQTIRADSPDKRPRGPTERQMDAHGAQMRGKI